MTSNKKNYLRKFFPAYRAVGKACYIMHVHGGQVQEMGSDEAARELEQESVE